MRRRIVLAVLVALVGAVLEAHHSFSAEYDANQPISLQGQIARLDMVNPHSWLYLNVKGPDGTVTKWTVEMAPPHNLIRRGVTEAVLPIGGTITVDGYRARDGGTTVYGRQIRIADGRLLFTGSTTTSPAELK